MTAGGPGRWETCRAWRLTRRASCGLPPRPGSAARPSEGWRFYEGKDGLPWNDFTGMAAGRDGEVWFATHLGAMRFDGKEWQYRQGPRWLPHDDVAQVAVDAKGNCLVCHGWQGWAALSAGR